jgi:type I restriction enzyme S subunit
MPELNCIDLIVCTPGNRLLPAFFCATLNSFFGRRQFAAGSAGTAQQHFNVGALRQFRLPVPALSVQRDAVRTLEELDAAFDAIAARRTRLRAMDTAAMSTGFGS